MKRLKGLKSEAHSQNSGGAGMAARLTYTPLRREDEVCFRQWRCSIIYEVITRCCCCQGTRARRVPMVSSKGRQPGCWRRPESVLWSEWWDSTCIVDCYHGGDRSYNFHTDSLQGSVQFISLVRCHCSHSISPLSSGHLHLDTAARRRELGSKKCFYLNGTTKGFIFISLLSLL